MPSSHVQVRPFRRDDRDQLADLVNAHVQAVVPGASVAVNTLLGQMEREPGEFIVDPWVRQRHTLVAERDGRIAAAAHLLRYHDGDEVGETYRDAGEIRWLVCAPEAPFWPDAAAAGDAVAAAALAVLTRSGAVRIHADGALPAPGIYGIPEQWPHVADILRRAGFTPGTYREVVLLVEVGALARQETPLPGLTVRRSVGGNGTRLTAMLGDTTSGTRVGHVEVEPLRAHRGPLTRQDGWADVGELYVDPEYRRRRVGTWLLGRAAEWLRLAHVDRLLDYADATDTDYLAFLRHAGFTELSTTTRVWTHDGVSSS